MAGISFAAEDGRSAPMNAILGTAGSLASRTGSSERTPEATVAVETYTTDIEALLGDEAEYLLQHRSETFPKESLHLPGPDFIDRVVVHSDRNVQTLRNLQGMFSHGRLGGTGYVSILPVDQGIEHSAGASFAPNPEYFDPEKIVELAVEGGCNAVASTFGVLGMVARKWATKIPFIVKVNHNELLSYPNTYDQTLYGNVHRAWEMGATGLGATVYFGSAESRRQLIEISEAFSEAHDLGMFTVLWCYIRNSDFKQNGTDYSLAADLTGQANHLGVTIEADIIKQKLPENNGGFEAIGFGKTDDLVYSKLTTDHPIDLCRYQVANCYMGRAGLINSGGASNKDSDKAEVVRTAVINKRAGGTGLISGRKAFQRPMSEGVEILNAIQDVYLSPEVTIA
jgi:fructose-bisphosphate aldolase, class I